MHRTRVMYITVWYILYAHNTFIYKPVGGYISVLRAFRTGSTLIYTHHTRAGVDVPETIYDSYLLKFNAVRILRHIIIRYIIIIIIMNVEGEKI